MKVKRKMMILFMLIAIIPLIIIAFYYDYTSYNNMKETVSLLSNRIVNQTKVGINDRIKNMEKDLHVSVNNQDILDIFMELPSYDVIKASFEKEKIGKSIDAMIYNTPYLDSVIIDLYDYKTLTFGEGGREGKISNTIKYLTSEEFKGGSYYKKAKENTNEPIWIDQIEENDNKIYVMKEFKYFMYAKKMGIVIFVIDENMINDYIKTIDEVEIIGSNTVIDVDNSKIVVGDEIIISGNEKFDNSTFDIDLNSKITTIEEKDSFSSYCKLENGWILINSISKDTVFEGINKTRRNTIIFIISGTILSCIAGVIISRNTEIKLSRLISKFEKVEKGDFTVDVQIKDDDEYGMLEEHFNNMVNELDSLIKDNYLCRLEAKEAHLSALQYQINPHFLYNTLEVINAIAATYKANEIREITQNLGNMFRYNISGGSNEFTTVKKEINHIKNYIYLHQLHLPFKLEVFFDIDEDVYNAKILKFTMHPIIENIVKHAFRDRYSDGCIEISAEVSDKFNIVVQDDGNGMSDEKLMLLLNSLNLNESDLKKQEIGGIGLRNIQERIKLNFGEEYGIDIDSVEGIGTKITIKIPYIV